jgi:acetoin utilization protein AcuB
MSPDIPPGLCGPPVATGAGMTTQIPQTVRSYMTPIPMTVGPQVSLADAHTMMRQHQVRHLPVVRAGEILGMVTSRDLALIESLADVDPTEVTVDEAMSTEVYAVSPDAPLRMVASDMAERKIGSTVVVDGTAVIGIFTVTDACRALALVLGLAHG